MTDGDPRSLWDPLAGWWKQTFTDGADPEYDRQILPLVTSELAGARRVLDLGCGEGQVTRALLTASRAATGAVAAGADRAGAPRRSPAAGAARLGMTRAVGLDPSRAQLANALAAGAGTQAGAARGRVAPSYVQGRGEQLPFAGSSFDAVVCCLAIEHTNDVDAVLAEVARVLEPGGQFLLLVNHPMFQGTGSGFIDDRILGERYWRVGPYLVEDVTWEHVDAGVELPFAHRPLSRYLNPLAERDVLLVHMEEPPPHPDFLATSVDPELEGAIPRLLAMRFERRPRAAAIGQDGRSVSSNGDR
jgi:SAM-dependent methyltransferase